uniref:Uncharacterized protein n=1 Tax=Cacopsylla melanoneura TaxID=428564 RepID=A0A8D9BAP2_9HEMI
MYKYTVSLYLPTNLPYYCYSYMNLFFLFPLPFKNQNSILPQFLLKASPLLVVLPYDNRSDDLLLTARGVILISQHKFNVGIMIFTKHLALIHRRSRSMMYP